jgi:hypothetical protein
MHRKPDIGKRPLFVAVRKTAYEREIKKHSTVTVG